MFMALNMKNNNIGIFDFKHGGISSPLKIREMIDDKRFYEFPSEGACFAPLTVERDWSN